jgi:hypothetical protein
VVGLEVLGAAVIPFGLAAAASIRRWSARSVDLGVVYLLLGFLFSCAATLRDGAAENYFLATLAVACVVGGKELSLWMKGGDSTEPGDASQGNTVSRGVLVLCFGCCFFLPRAGLTLLDLKTTALEFHERGNRDKTEREYFRNASKYLNDLNGPILCQHNTLNLFLEDTSAMDLL